MSQQVQELIDKIKSEGVEAAQKRAQEIETQAHTKAQQILSEAKAKAERMIADSREEISKLQESTQMALKQSARDTLLSLKKEIEKILKRIIEKEIADSLTPEALCDILSEVVKDSLTQGETVHITLNPYDFKKLEAGFAAKLQKQIKKPIKFQSSEEIGRGFTISYDAGKSSFDFTDKSLAEYLSTFLNSQTAALLKNTV